MSLIDRIPSTQEFIDRPPVLIDIGASGAIHKKWKKIARHAICIAFDADERDFDPGSSEKSLYKKLLIKKSLVSDKSGNDTDFYLTASPHCSSLLQPDKTSLANWAYAPLFIVEKIVKLNTTDIKTALTDFSIHYIDWYKSDSQGIDLKLFKSLPENIRDKIVIAEFEPGILDAYHDEDKLNDMLTYHDCLKKFWLAELSVKGTLRMPFEKLKEVIGHPFLQKLVAKVGKISPGWAEMAYINNFTDPAVDNKRALMMGWIGATLLKQHGFAYSLAGKAAEKYDDPLFSKMQSSSARKVIASLISFRYVTLLIKKLF